MNPLLPLLLVLLIPLIYSKKKVFPIIICSITIVLLYPLPLQYTLKKIILFILLPILTIYLTEKWKLKDILKNLGINKNLKKAYYTV